MNSIDANILLYAYNQHSLRHAQALAWLQQELAGSAEIGLPFQSVLAFVRISTHPKLFPEPLTLIYALDTVDLWLGLPNVRLLQAGVRHWSIFRQLCTSAKLTGDLATDAHLAAITIEHDAMLCTTDSDFARFAGLRWRNPLQA